MAPSTSAGAPTRSRSDRDKTAPPKPRGLCPWAFIISRVLVFTVLITLVAFIGRLLAMPGSVTQNQEGTLVACLILTNLALFWSVLSWSGYSKRHIRYTITWSVDLGFVVAFVGHIAMIQVAIQNNPVCVGGDGETDKKNGTEICSTLGLVWSLSIGVCGLFAISGGAVGWVYLTKGRGGQEKVEELEGVVVDDGRIWRGEEIQIQKLSNSRSTSRSTMEGRVYRAATPGGWEDPRCAGLEGRPRLAEAANVRLVHAIPARVQQSGKLLSFIEEEELQPAKNVHPARSPETDTALAKPPRATRGRPNSPRPTAYGELYMKERSRPRHGGTEVPNSQGARQVTPSPAQSFWPHKSRRQLPQRLGQTRPVTVTGTEGSRPHAHSSVTRATLGQRSTTIFDTPKSTPTPGQLAAADILTGSPRPSGEAMTREHFNSLIAPIPVRPQTRSFSPVSWTGNTTCSEGEEDEESSHRHTQCSILGEIPIQSSTSISPFTTLTSSKFHHGLAISGQHPVETITGQGVLPKTTYTAPEKYAVPEEILRRYSDSVYESEYRSSLDSEELLGEGRDRWCSRTTPGPSRTATRSSRATTGPSTLIDTRSAKTTPRPSRPADEKSDTSGHRIRASSLIAFPYTAFESEQPPKIQQLETKAAEAQPTAQPVPQPPKEQYTWFNWSFGGKKVDTKGKRSRDET